MQSDYVRRKEKLHASLKFLEQKKKKRNEFKNTKEKGKGNSYEVATRRLYF
jgi:hypothetical protein